MADRPGAVVVGGHANGTGVVRALARVGVTVDVVLTLRSDMAHRSRFVRHHHWLLEIDERPESLIELLERNQTSWRGWAILPTNDYALTALAQYHERLWANFRLTSPPWEMARRVLDKTITNRLASEIGIAVPKTYGKATRAFSGSGDLTYPVLVKPVQGHTFTRKFNKKLFVVRNVRELMDAIERVEHVGFDCEIVAFISGPDRCIREYKVYIDASGVPHGEFAVRKLRQEPPVFGVGRAAEPTDPAALREPSLALLRRIGWRGYAEVSFKTDPRDGRDYLLEVNGRFGLMDGLALRSGMNYPLMAYSEAVSGGIRGVEPNGWRGVWLHIHADFFSTLKNLGKEQFTWREFLQSYLRPKTFAVFAVDDPWPFLQQWWSDVEKAPRWLSGAWRSAVMRLREAMARRPRDAARSNRSV